MTAPASRVPSLLFLAPHTACRVTALVHTIHSLTEIQRRAQHLGLSLSEVQDPAPCVMAVPDGYRFVRAVVTATRAITLPTKLPAPLSWYDHSRVVSVTQEAPSPATSMQAHTGEDAPPEKTHWPTVAWTGAALAGVVGAFWMALRTAGRPGA